ncbi:MAG TPA: hypothetical protein VK846_04580 [Candidatus Limnocylindria bacterium]|nr:hypothetical protein [Candidatus Limnocylindria bacterium]
MTEAFIPFTTKSSASDAAEPFRVKVVPAAIGAAVPFQPIASVANAASPAKTHNGHEAKAQVSLVREGDRITGIRVQCACGEVIELQCVY